MTHDIDNTQNRNSVIIHQSGENNSSHVEQSGSNNSVTINNTDISDRKKKILKRFYNSQSLKTDHSTSDNTSSINRSTVIQNGSNNKIEHHIGDGDHQIKTEQEGGSSEHIIYKK